MQKKKENLPKRGNYEQEEKYTVAEKLQYLKRRYSLTTATLSQYSGVPIGTLNKLLSGATLHPTLDTMERLASFFRVPLRYFVDDFAADSPQYEMGALIRKCDVLTITVGEGEMLKAFRTFSRCEQKVIEGLILTMRQLKGVAPDADQTITLPCYFAAPGAGEGTLAGSVMVSMLQIEADAVARQADFLIRLNSVALEPLYKKDSILALCHRKAKHGEIGFFIWRGKGYIREHYHRRGVQKLLTINKEVANVRIGNAEELKCLGTVIGQVKGHGKAWFPPGKP